MKFFQAKAVVSGVAYEGDCHSGEDFAVKALVHVVMDAEALDYPAAIGALMGRVEVVEV